MRINVFSAIGEAAARSRTGKVYCPPAVAGPLLPMEWVDTRQAMLQVVSWSIPSRHSSRQRLAKRTSLQCFTLPIVGFLRQCIRLAEDQGWERRSLEPCFPSTMLLFSTSGTAELMGFAAAHSFSYR